MLNSSRQLLNPLRNNFRYFSSFETLQAPKQFLVIAKDFTDAECLQRRLDARGKHFEDAISANKNDVLNLGGPIFDDHESRKMKGSFLIVTAESESEVEKMLKSDHYYESKVWEKWDILPVNPAIGRIA